MDNKTKAESVVFEEYASNEKPVGNVKEVTTTSVALAAAFAAQKPKLLSKNMLKLYFIMSIGYLVSTMNGFGMRHPALHHLSATDLVNRQLLDGINQRNVALPTRQ